MQKLINRCFVHLASVVKPSVVQTGVCLLCITTLFACSSDDGGVSTVTVTEKVVPPTKNQQAQGGSMFADSPSTDARHRQPCHLQLTR